MKLFDKTRRVLVLAPHTDDGEFGCGGTIARLVEEGAAVYYAAFSACQQSVLPQFPSDILITEVKAATRELGIRPENLFLFDFEVRTFGFRRQEVLDRLLELRQRLQPDVVFMPTLADVHQDHQTIAQEGLRAFKFSTILCYEMPWNNLNFNTSCFIHLTPQQLGTKARALAQYRSQAHRPYASEEFVHSLARVRGVQISTQYAETFEVVRWIWT